MPWNVYNQHGQRKYLTESEVNSFIKASNSSDMEIRTFCCMLAFTGCRISEALSMTCDSIDFNSQHVVIRCLKKRGKLVYRAIPIPSDFLKTLDRWIGSNKSSDERLWPWSRMTGYRRVRDVMELAQIKGNQATPKGLRHGFGIRAIQAGVPLTLVQRWLGHADIKTTAIYTSAIGPEEREIAARMWHRKPVVGQNRATMSRRRAEHRAQATPSGNYPRTETSREITLVEPTPAMDSPLFDNILSMLRQMPEEQQGSTNSRLTPCGLIQFWIYCIRNFVDFPTPYSLDRAVSAQVTPGQT